MNEEQLSNEISNLLNVPFYLTASSLALDLLAAMLVFAGVIITFTSSNRPGKTLMLVGLVGVVLSYLPFLFASDEFSNKAKFLFFYLPIVGSAFLAITATGFFKLALSFKNEG